MSKKRREKFLFQFDERFREDGHEVIAGIDEAGRGPLAGPVVAAAVIFRKKISLPSLNDSKQVLPETRKALFWKIISHAIVGVGTVAEGIIDEINILQATRAAMKQAVLALSRTPTLLLIDGPIRLDLPLAQLPLIDRDCKSASIAAASIVAKVCRDSFMENLDGTYPEYGFARHKGYPTPEHLEVLRAKGPTKIHRKSFAPVAAASFSEDFCDE